MDRTLASLSSWLDRDPHERATSVARLLEEVWLGTHVDYRSLGADGARSVLVKRLGVLTLVPLDDLTMVEVRSRLPR